MAIRPWRQQPLAPPGLMVAEAYMTHLASALKMNSSLGSANQQCLAPQKDETEILYSKGGKLTGKLYNVRPPFDRFR